MRIRLLVFRDVLPALDRRDNEKCGARFQQSTGFTGLVRVLMREHSALSFIRTVQGSIAGTSPTYSPAPSSSVAALPPHYVDARKGRRGQGAKRALTGTQCVYSCSKA